MKFAEVAENVKQLVATPPPKDEFIYALLLAYGTPKNTVTLAQKGARNLSKDPGDVLLKKKVWFKKVEQASRLPNQDEPNDNKQAGRSLYVEIEELKASKKTKTNDPRFLIVVEDCRAKTVVGNGFQEREKHPGKTMLYDPDTTKRSEKECHEVTGRRPTSQRGVQMPAGLREAHHNLDLAVDRIYRSKPFASDEERLEHLFKLYEEMTVKEKLI
jgi:hypothetical protein